VVSSLFPALLAGPMLRRVEASSAFIWVATSREFSIHADLFHITIGEEGDHYTKLATNSETKTVPLGKHLFIHLIEITPEIGLLPTNQLIGYNLFFENHEELYDLGDLGLLTKNVPENIIYGSLKYPSFIISEKEADQTSNFFFGSCRKPHGEGEDALAYGDRVIAENYHNIAKRPKALFLMGDQIYADDIPDPLFRPINLLGKELMGVGEDLASIDKRLASIPFSTSLNRVNGRNYTMNKLAKFTSKNAFNHLIEFGEYAAMYLFLWSPVLWELSRKHNLIESFDRLVEQGHIDVSFSKINMLRTLEVSQLKKRYSEQEKNMENFQSAIYKVRRLLANIPTYMIFDDHDITDDWNITSEWKETVRVAPFGKHVVANGLSAYWAFQGWGNQPEIFKGDFISRIENYFNSLQTGQMKKAHYDSWINMLWEHRPWYFVTPTTPKAVFLDTRTMREYENNSKNITLKSSDDEVNHPPQLVNDQEFKEISIKLEGSGWKKGEPLIIISPTPVIGFEFIENTVSKFSYPLKMLGARVETVLDVEAWKYNGKGLTHFFNQLSDWNPKPCMILSGDVHYSFSVNSSVLFSDGQPIKVKQITSSPLKNMSFPSLSTLLKLTASMGQILKQGQRLYRYCDSTYQIHNVERNDLPTNQYLWKEQISYDCMNSYSIMETENNLGFLSFSANQFENNFIMKENNQSASEDK
jgi:hypothetical protein